MRDDEAGRHLTLLAPGADLVDEFARALIERERASLPDLTRCWILLPSIGDADRLALRLAHHAGRGLLGPRVSTLASFAAQQPGPSPLSALECRLLLTEALRRFRKLFPGQDRAQVAEALFELFEELTAAHFEPGADASAFEARLRQAYGAPALSWLSREAQIVHQLWQAFEADSQGRSPATVHLRKLRAGFVAATAESPAQLLGFDEFSRGEAALIGDAMRAGRAHLWLQGPVHGRDAAALKTLAQQLQIELPAAARAASPRSALLDAAFGELAPAASIPADCALRLVEAAGAEHEARCVDLAVRQALLAGKEDIVVLTQDRRLARRLRALLERAAVPLQDHGGWALSTSRAAAALDAWLECIEGRFRFRPLLALLKSGFVEADAAALDTLERKLVYGNGIDGGLPALLGAANSDSLQALLKKLKDAAFSLPRSDESRPAQRWTESLLRSLEHIGLAQRLDADTAGVQLSRVLAQLHAAFARVPLSLRWDEFRSLLDGALERGTFSPDASRSPVRLLTLDQAQGLHCELLVLAGATREQLPGSPPRLPFFSASVRNELGLPDWRARQDLALMRLRNALDGAAEVLITWSAGTEDEPAQASPWIEAIEAQASRAGLALRDPALAQLAASGAAEIGDDSAGAAAPFERPAPSAPTALLPERLSATAHQALLDCPYRFFARSVLKLEAEHAPDEDPNRKDYGERVHKILEAFAQPVPDMPHLPPPFTEHITAASRPRAHARLTEIADAVFAPDLSRRALALTWKAEFRAAIPGLLDWMTSRWLLREVRAEVDLSANIEGLRIYGRVDRLETRTDGSQVVVDYKSGKLPKPDDIASGEAVQLLHYALLDPHIAAVEYRPLRRSENAQVYDTGLPALRDAVRARLASVVRALQAGAPLPAQGNEAVCEHCEYTGLCRREDWHG